MDTITTFVLGIAAGVLLTLGALRLIVGRMSM